MKAKSDKDHGSQSMYPSIIFWGFSDKRPFNNVNWNEKMISKHGRMVSVAGNNLKEPVDTTSPSAIIN